ncbi:MAG: hypothetical protein KF729_13010 [Sandaracinaceae bacterium]|nr:hypothetical protein [Sandaracinaceae bacterium]
MGEVLLSVDVGDASPASARAFADALGRRRYRRVEGVPGAYACHFEHGFVDEVRRIVAHDLRAAAEEASVSAWRAAHAWSAAGHALARAADVAPRAEGDAGGAPWADGAAPVGPLADVLLLLGVAPQDEAPLARALVARGWARADGLGAALVHRYDLGMFAPLEARVRRDVVAAAAEARVAAWAAAWCASSFEHTVVEGEPARVARRLPWDPVE